MSICPPKLGYVSSVGRRSGLVLRPGGVSGLEGRRVVVDMRTRPAVSMTGEECALVMGGAVRELAVERDRRWLRENGDRLHDRKGNVLEAEVCVDEVAGAGSVARRGLTGLVSESSDLGVSGCSSGSCKIGGDISGGGKASLGTILRVIRRTLVRVVSSKKR